MTRLLSFREHLGHEEILSPAEVEIVRASPLKLDLERVGDGLYRITPSSIVGTDVAEDLRIVVVPKLPISRLLYVLCAYPEGLKLGRWVAQAEADDTLAVLAEVYREALDRALVFGLPQDYREERGDLELFRGRIDLLDLQCRHAGLFPQSPATTMNTQPTRNPAAGSLLRPACSAAGRLRDQKPPTGCKPGRVNSRRLSLSPTILVLPLRLRRTG